MTAAETSTTLGGDINSCDREPIHQLGGVQGYGFLIAVSSSWIVQYVSANVDLFLDVDPPDLIGSPLSAVLDEDTIHLLRNKLQSLRVRDDIERVFNLPLSKEGRIFDVSLYLSDELIVIEGEPSLSESQMNSSALVRGMITRLRATDVFTVFCREAARQVRMLSGFDRVMIYRFNRDASGEVIAESAKAGLPPFLGLRYPASDIPQQARALYERSWLRLIVDVDGEVSPIIPKIGLSGQPLDLSLSTMRAVSPIHLEYLRNMGVAASMSISIMRGGKLWGLIACHHMRPRYLSSERRTALELFGLTISLLVESREREAEATQEAQARLTQNTLMTAIATEGTSLENLSQFFGELRSLLQCDGIGIWLGEKWMLDGLTPTYEEFSGIVRFLNNEAGDKVYATDHMGAVYPPAQDFTERAAGLLAIPVSRMARDYIVFFRREVTQTVTWAGDPVKAATTGPNGVRLTPRKSFEAWQEIVRQQSLPWNDIELRIADSLRITLLEVVLRLTEKVDTTQRASQQKQELLIAELNHRVRNILSLVKGLLAQTSPTGSIEDYVNVVGGRIQALARAHDQITSDDWQPASLRGLIHAESEAYLSGKMDRIRIEGDEVVIAPQAFSTLALVMHEMMTNSAKYGAMCDRSGWVTIKWHKDGLGHFIIDWKERGGPAVRPPSRRGFGSTIIERSIPFDLKGEASIDYELDGVHARFVIPDRLVSPGEIQAAKPVSMRAETSYFDLQGPMLMVEDNIIIAMDAEDALRDMGITEVSTFSTVADTLRYLENTVPAAALVDFNLGNETSTPIAERLRELGVPFFFATGYGEALHLPDGLSRVTVVKKPYQAKMLRIALADCLAS